MPQTLQTRRALLVEVRRAAANDAVLFPAKLLKPSNRAKLGCPQNYRVISSDIFFFCQFDRGFTGCAPSRQCGRQVRICGQPEAMLAGHKVVQLSDCRLILILGTVLHSTRETQSVQTRGFVFSANSKVTIQIVNSCGDISSSSHSLTLAPRCPVSLPMPAARVNSPPRDRLGTNRATAAVRSFAC